MNAALVIVDSKTHRKNRFSISIEMLIGDGIKRWNDHRTEAWSKPTRWACSIDVHVPRFADNLGLEGYCAILRMLRFLTDAMQIETRPNVIAKYKEQIAAARKALVREV